MEFQTTELMMAIFKKFSIRFAPHEETCEQFARIFNSTRLHPMWFVVITVLTTIVYRVYKIKNVCLCTDIGFGYR